MRKLKNEIVTVGVDSGIDLPIYKRFLRGKMRDFTIKTLAVIEVLIELLAVIAVIVRWW